MRKLAPPPILPKLNPAPSSHSKVKTPSSSGQLLQPNGAKGQFQLKVVRPDARVLPHTVTRLSPIVAKSVPVQPLGVPILPRTVIDFAENVSITQDILENQRQTGNIFFLL